MKADIAALFQKGSNVNVAMNLYGTARREWVNISEGS